jgi:acyl-coenzyme A synthetase/AMP-(fatty) acid ligase
MLRATLPAMPKLRHGLCAGEKLPEITRIAWQEATRTGLHEAYGLSECSTFVSGSPARPAPPGTLGWPQPGRQAALRDGQIAVHRSDPGLMLGYLNAPKETAARFDGDWFLTGDLARKTDDGALICEGRADDMLNAGGLRVSPLEIETVMEAHPAIEEAAACDLCLSPDTTVIGLFYTGTLQTDETLTAHAATRLARWKHPRLYIHREALPRSANGKLLRRTLKSRWETDHGQA